MGHVERERQQPASQSCFSVNLIFFFFHSVEFILIFSWHTTALAFFILHSSSLCKSIMFCTKLMMMIEWRMDASMQEWYNVACIDDFIMGKPIRIISFQFIMNLYLIFYYGARLNCICILKIYLSAIGALALVFRVPGEVKPVISLKKKIFDFEFFIKKNSRISFFGKLNAISLMHFATRLLWHNFGFTIVNSPN